MLEEKLTGGNFADSVTRIGMTVRKPATKATPAVHNFLRYLHLSGFEDCPQPFGLDEKGRQVLEFIPGTKVHESGRNIPIDLRRVGSLVRAFHGVSASYKPDNSDIWDPPSKADGEEVICHNDLAPWNLIVGAERWVFIDWDNAAPGTRLWDLAWTAISFPPVKLDQDLRSLAKAIRALGDGYGLDLSEYDSLIALMADRAQAASDRILDGVRNNDPVAMRLYADNHHNYWGPVSELVRQHSDELESLILNTGGSDGTK